MNVHIFSFSPKSFFPLLILFKDNDNEDVIFSGN